MLLTLLLGACGEMEKPSISLYLASQRGDIEQIERHIKWGSDINELDKDGEAPLHVAAQKGRIAIARLLLKHGADIDLQSASGHTPAYYAILSGRTRLADLLLKQGASIDASKLLLQAAHRDIPDRDAIVYLAAHGADLETRDAQGDTALIIAIRHGNHRMARHLVTEGADVNVQDTEGKTAIQIAKEAGLRDIAQLLKRQGAESNEE
jgi:ankyrin repeat protein